MDQPRQSLRNVYHFTRTLNEFGLLPRLFFRAVRDVTDRQCSAFMHWGIIVDNKIFELSGNSKVIEHRFMSKPLTADEAEKFQYKEYRGKTAYTDDQILQLGQQLVDSTGDSYDLLTQNCQDLIDRLLRKILVSDTVEVPRYKQTLQQRFGDVLDLMPEQSRKLKIGVMLGRVIHSS